MLLHGAQDHSESLRSGLVDSGMPESPSRPQADNEPMATASNQNRQELVRRGQRLEYFTIVYNSAEGLVSIIAGIVARSVSLIGFGLDSLIEVTSGAALLWRLHHDFDHSRREQVEWTTLRIVGACFLALAAYIAYESASTLIRHEPPGVIPLLFRGLAFDAVQYPLKGLQGYNLQQLSDILREISRRMGIPLGEVDADAVWEEIKHIQADLPSKKLALAFRPTLSYPKWNSEFLIVNDGNRDVEPLEVTIWIPSAILYSPYSPAIDAAILEVRQQSVDNVTYTEITYRNNREPTMPDRFSKPERLVACLSPGAPQRLQLVRPEIRFPLEAHELDTPTAPIPPMPFLVTGFVATAC